MSSMVRECINTLDKDRDLTDNFTHIRNASIELLVNMLKEKNEELLLIISILLKKSPEHRDWVEKHFGYLLKG